MIGSQHLFITVLGSSKTGKSCLTRRFLENKYDANIDEETIEDTFRKKINFNRIDFSLKIIDIGDPIENDLILKEWIPISDGFLFVYDAKNPSTFDELKKIVEKIVSERGKNCGMVIAGNKSEGKVRVLKEKGIELAQYVLGEFFETSSKHDLNVNEIFLTIIKNIIEKRPKVNKLAYIEKKSQKENVSTLVLIHGLNSSKETWNNIINSKEFEDLNLIAIDLQGHGESEIQNHNFSTEQMIKDLENFFQEKKLENFYLLGHSMGVRVVVPYAINHPKRIKGLILEDMILTKKELQNPTTEEWEEMKLFNRFTTKEKLIKGLIKNGYNLDRIEKWIIDGRIKIKDEKYYSGVHPYVAKMSYLNLISTLDCYDAFKKLQDLKFPVLLLRAEKYSPMDDIGTKEMRDLYEDLEYHFIKGSEHSIHKGESEDKFKKLVKDFIK